MRATTLLMPLLLLALAAPVLAQPRRRAIRVDRMMLLSIDDVQDELSLSADQIAAVEQAAQKLGEPAAPRGRFQELTDEERDELRAKAQKRAGKEKELLAEILSTEQGDRLSQILLQVMGSRALQDPDLAKELEITADQRQQIADARQEATTKMRATMRELFQEGGGDFAEMRERMQELREDMEDQVLQHLTDVQRSKFAEMKGEEFRLPMDALFRGRGGRGFGGGRRPGGEGRPERPQRPAID